MTAPRYTYKGRTVRDGQGQPVDIRHTLAFGTPGHVVTVEQAIRQVERETAAPLWAALPVLGALVGVIWWML
jgi:hypothetical protein